VRAEFDALRRVASLAADYLELETTKLREGVGERAALAELRAALEDLTTRFPYTLERRTPALDVALTRSAQAARGRAVTRRR
jgi:hypothetical protein